MICFTIPGRAAAKGSKKGFVVKGRAILVDANAKTKVWENAVREVAALHRNGELLGGPLHIGVTFQFARPRSHFRTGRNADKLRDTAPNYHTGKPDCDKLLRALGDGLTGVLLTDDSVVSHWSAWKVYGDCDETSVKIETIPTTPTPERNHERSD